VDLQIPSVCLLNIHYFYRFSICRCLIVWIQIWALRSWNHNSSTKNVNETLHPFWRAWIAVVCTLTLSLSIPPYFTLSHELYLNLSLSISLYLALSLSHSLFVLTNRICNSNHY
jgi:hypothetical protein